MKALLNTVAKLAARAVPALAIAAVAALSLGAYTGYAARSASRRHRPTFNLTASPSHDTIASGSTAGYRLSVRRRRFPWRITLSVSGRLPRGAAAHFAPSRTPLARSTLTIRTRSWTTSGTYHLVVRAKHGRVVKRLTLTLTVADTYTSTGTVGVSIPPFSIDGNAAAPLEPGAPQSIDLQITNPNAAPLVVSALTATVRSIAAPQATAALPCTLGDFAVQQFSGATPLTVPASSTKTLAELGVPPAAWPQISIVDLPTDQDGCKGASLALAYTGVATLG